MWQRSAMGLAPQNRARAYLACVVIIASVAPASLYAEEHPSPIAADHAGSQRSDAAPSAFDPTEPVPAEPTPSGISGNLAAVNIVAGSGLLGRALGFGPESGVRIGGVWVGNANLVIAGGEKPWQRSFNSLLVADLNLDFARLAGIQGGQFGVQFLQFNGQPTNREAGVVTGFNGLTGPPPLVRSELYQLWWRQSFFDEKLVVRAGKSVPTYDFNNIARAVETREKTLWIPSVTSLIYTPAFVNTTMLGVLPGYYNSAYGITTTLAPSESLYLSYGAYDGNGARDQTGLRTTPQFNGYYFQIAEAGYSWLLGSGTMPGGAAVGAWDQTGKLTGPTAGIVQTGTHGIYTFGSQRLWNRHPGVDSSGVSGFFQFGINDSRTLIAHRYFGLGLTGFGLIPGRPADTIGGGLAWSWLTRSFGFRSNETILAVYYQAKILDGLFLQPVLSYIPNPGATPKHDPAAALTVQTTVLF
jgi:porin